MIYSIPPVDKTVTVDSAEDVFVPCTPWLDSLEAAGPVGYVHMVLHLVAASGNNRVRPAIQTCDHDEYQANEALNPASAGDYVFKQGQKAFYRIKVTDADEGDLTRKALFRLGFFASLTSGNTAETASVTLKASWR